MSYITLHKSNERFELGVSWLLVSAALMTLALMFVHPFFAILTFWFGLLVAGASAIIEAYVRRCERSEARKAMAAHACPACGSLQAPPKQASLSCRCDQCGAEFSADGEAVWTND